jgi:hypothetical protein
MPIGTTNIKMSDIATELQYASTGLSDNSMVNILYDSSQLSNNSHGGSYHNTSMGSGTNFQISIEGPYSAGTYMALKNWGGYNHDIGVNLNYIINNGSGYDVNVRLFLETSPSYGGGFQFFAGIIPMNNMGNVNVANFNTTSAAFSSYYPVGGYWISGDISLLMPPAGRPVNMNVTSAVDTDNKGSGIPRFNYTANGFPGGPWNLDPGSGGGPFVDILASGDNSSPFPTDGISWNKRTAIVIDIT